MTSPTPAAAAPAVPLASGRRFSRAELLATMTATFALGILAAWAGSRLGQPASPIAESSAATAPITCG